MPFAIPRDLRFWRRAGMVQVSYIHVSGPTSHAIVMRIGGTTTTSKSGLSTLILYDQLALSSFAVYHP